MEKIINGHRLTSNEEMDYFQVGDNSNSVTGVIIRLDPGSKRRSSNAGVDNTPFRCILSNMAGRCVRILFWPPRKQEFEGKVLQQIIKISRPQIVQSNPKFLQPQDNLMSIELSVQKNTKIELLGIMPDTGEELDFEKIDFDSIGQKIGKLVCIKGFVKSTFETVVSGNSSYGSGALTDGYFRLPVNFTTFEETVQFVEGQCVVAKGKLRNNDFNTIFLQIADMKHISLLEEKMTEEQMKFGFHPVELENSNENDNFLQRRRRSSENHVNVPTKISKTKTLETEDGNSSMDDMDFDPLL